MQTTSVNPREAHAVFLRNKLTLPIDDPFWNKHRPGEQRKCPSQRLDLKAILPRQMRYLAKIIHTFLINVRTAI